MQTLFVEYTYFTATILFLLLFFVCLLVSKTQRKEIMLSALLSAPFGLLSVFFVPEYWDPARIIEGYSIGIEDLIFSFENGGIVWFCVTFPFNNKLSTDINARKLLTRYFTILLIGGSISHSLLLLGCKPMTATMIGLIILVSILLYLKFNMWKLVVRGALIFGTMYLMIFIIINLNPDFISQWNQEALSGYHIWNVPVEEVVWSFGFGAQWPIFMAYCFDAKNST